MTSVTPEAIAALYPDAVAALVARAIQQAEIRAFLQRGWARALMRYERTGTLDAARRLRGRLHGIAVVETPGDEWAAQYQRLAFRRDRIARAIGQYGVRSRSVWDDAGFRHVEPAVIAAENTAALARIRARAHRAKARARDSGPPIAVIQDGMARLDQDAPI